MYFNILIVGLHIFLYVFKKNVKFRSKKMLFTIRFINIILDWYNLKKKKIITGIIFNRVKFSYLAKRKMGYFFVDMITKIIFYPILLNKFIFTKH